MVRKTLVGKVCRGEAYATVFTKHSRNGKSYTVVAIAEGRKDTYLSGAAAASFLKLWRDSARPGSKFPA